MTRRRRPNPRVEASLPATDPLSLALEAYEAAFGATPTVMDLGAASYPGLAAVLRKGVAERL